ncbi:MAG: uroporphyrinogen decarboxylase family protein [Candidatus Hydrogenedentes bacterium]|nr:uroporphyrinogen decarboxylase family protein [Candidatus Hydrogenedentota bacterium]
MGFPGVSLVKSDIKTAQQNYGEHYKAVERLASLFEPDLVFPLMDLSVEANAMGRYTIFPRNDSATVPRDAFSIEELERLRSINISFDSRLNCYVETVKLMRIGLAPEIIRGAYVSGPYSLASLIMGAQEAGTASLMDPDTLTTLCDFVTERIQEYMRLLICAGAEVICILEPSAVMLSPALFEQFSASYVRHLTDSFKYSGTQIVYHTCGNTMHVVEKMVGAGVAGISLDSPEAGVDLPAVAKVVPESVVVIGNINPATTVLNGTPEQLRDEVNALLKAMDPFPNFVLSTGCDLPQETPPENILAFMRAGRSYRIGCR